MFRSRISIRHQLLILGALATSSIWMGALLQFLQLREESVQITGVRGDLTSVARYEEAARMAAQERGLTNGWLSQASSASSSLVADARQRLDARVSELSDASLLKVNALGTPPGLRSSIERLPDARKKIDHREISAVQAFDFYSEFVAEFQDVAAGRLATGMLAIGLPYEHVNYLHRMAEQLAQIRGTVNGTLNSHQLSIQTEATLTRERVLYEDALRSYQRSAPDATRLKLQSLLDSPASRTVLVNVRGILANNDLSSVKFDSASWWAVATQAVDSLQQAAQSESVSMTARADQRIDELELRLRWTVAALVGLGIVTIGLVLSTVGRIVRGLTQLIDGLNAVGDRRNFNARIENTGHDEFSKISGSINKLIAIAGSVVEEREVLSLTDSLTGAVNRRGFDQQLSARTTSARAQAGPLSVVMIDIDHFKSVNDTLGHARGDLVLQSFVQVLRDVVRQDDVLARFGGEEFVALLPGCPIDRAMSVAEKMRCAIEAHEFGIGRSLTASFGVAQWARGQTPEGLMADADAFLYAAKDEGRNRVCSSIPLKAVAS